MSEGPVRLVGGMSGSWVVRAADCGSVFKPLVVFYRQNFIALGRIFFFFNAPLSLSIILHHKSLTPSSITALTFRNYGLPSLWSTLNFCLTLIFCGLSLRHPAPAILVCMVCPSLWGKEPPGLPKGQQAAWACKANTAEWQNVICHGWEGGGLENQLHKVWRKENLSPVPAILSAPESATRCQDPVEGVVPCAFFNSICMKIELFLVFQAW